MSSHVRRVLIADDYELVRRGVKALLESRPTLQVVAEAASGREALEEAIATRPHIAIVDYALPELNGVDLTYALKRALPDIEVLIFTMHDREDLVLKALGAGAKGFVRKSDAEQHLLAGIDAIALHRHYLSGASEKVLEQIVERSQADHPTLTFREREVVQLVAEGQPNKTIARTLGLSCKTVETHRSAAMFKLKVRNTAQLVRYALRNMYIDA